MLLNAGRLPRIAGVAGFAALATCCFVRTAEASFTRYPADQEDFARVQAAKPNAAALLEKGEASAAAGKVAEAADLFHQASAEAPFSTLAARRECEAYTALGDQEKALKGCQLALQNGRSPLDLRATIRALLAGNEEPSIHALAQAITMAVLERNRRPDEIWGYAALCDVGERIGDEVMIEQCAENLVRLAPTDPATARAKAMLAAACPPYRVWLAWLTIAAAVLFTVAHAVRRTARKWRRPSAAAVVGAAVAILAHTTPARAGVAERPFEAVSDWPVDDKDPEKSVPTEADRNRNPLQFGYWLMDLSAKASLASKRHDHESAIHYYIAMIKAVPDRATGYLKLCEEYEASADRDKALAACSAALTHDGLIVKDYEHYVHLVLAKPSRLNAEEIGAIDEVLRHLRENPGGKASADELDCETALRIDDTQRLQSCSAALVASAPDDPKTLSFQWALAMKRGHYDEAKGIIERVKTTRMKPEGIRDMEQATSTAVARRRSNWILGGSGVLLLAIAVAGGGALLAKRRTMTSKPA